MNGKTTELLKTLIPVVLSLASMALLWYGTVNTSLATMSLELGQVRTKLEELSSDLRGANLGGLAARIDALDRRIELLEEAPRTTARRQ